MNLTLSAAPAPLGRATVCLQRRSALQGPGLAITATVFFLAALSWTPLLPVLLSVPFTVALLASVLVFALLTGNSLEVNRPMALVCAVLLMACILLLLLTQSTKLLLRTAPLPLLIFFAYQARAVAGLPQVLCNWLTRFLIVGVAGAIVGLAYAYFDGPPLLQFDNLDGRENGLYLSTLSNVNLLGIIRPSFIYDEAGAFSFIVCATVALRELLGRSRGASYFLMLGTLVTFSITHILLTILYLVFRLGPVRTLALTAALLAAVVPTAANNDELDFFFSRFEVEDGQIAGDNRSGQITNFFDVVNPRIVLFGDVDCHARQDGICEEHGDITSSPVTPTYKGGIVTLLVQIAVHIGLAVAFFKHARFRLAALMMTLLLLQRPYFDLSGYGFFTYFLLFLMLAPGPSLAWRPRLLSAARPAAGMAAGKPVAAGAGVKAAR